MQAEGRKEERVLEDVKIEISYAGIEDEWPKYMPAICINRSKSGLGIFTTLPLKEGRDLEVKGVLIPPEPFHVKATIMWCKRIGKDLYIAGVSLKHGDPIN